MVLSVSLQTTQPRIREFTLWRALCEVYKNINSAHHSIALLTTITLAPQDSHGPRKEPSHRHARHSLRQEAEVRCNLFSLHAPFLLTAHRVSTDASLEQTNVDQDQMKANPIQVAAPSEQSGMFFRWSQRRLQANLEATAVGGGATAGHTPFKITIRPARSATVAVGQSESAASVSAGGQGTVSMVSVLPTTTVTLKATGS